MKEDECMKSEHQGVISDCQHDNLSIIKARHSLDKEKSISEAITGETLTCEQVTEKITTLMSRTHAPRGNSLLSSLCT